jgi:hypothetical protein
MLRPAALCFGATCSALRFVAFRVAGAAVLPSHGLQGRSRCVRCARSPGCDRRILSHQAVLLAGIKGPYLLSCSINTAH